MTLGNNIIYY